ncbi:succinate-semialdehyde dehydrogenase (NADP(+)) [Sporosarcina sp. P12(2017)]|uniref:NAD-dependent succinate-semialdehyde dehydrogenase n=1 Tax=unclassified Sporosarcina TaxID=2647733 RepID=UPI000C17080E|nr:MULTISPECIES: NAD-dependent succinate-semialdehyde dehydrogenase [unclassified Sporosarcina]PIC57922.1 succinate-semialdehyde dehydrogenase (NADP(+)) [Sporosarcina sp. P10]PIC61305.1 succinate-semialdehyde dehydrogenase (NADP(+)) [Sporosarcina sp. P12(2017)]
MKSTEMIINGKRLGADLPQIEVVNPSTGETIGAVPKGGKAEAKQAVDAASAAFSDWAALSAYERSAYLMKWHALIEKNEESVAETMTTEQGKPLAEALGEMRYSNGYISWFAEEGKRIYGETIPATQSNKRMFVHKQPVGVIASITPWNFPAAMIARKVGPALAAGCTVVMKPASQTPLTAIRLIELAQEAGIPDGVLNIVTGSASEIAEAWQEDGRVRKLTFTGSTEIGKTLMKGAADTMKKISLELGGQAPAIIMADADLDKAVDGVIAAKFRNAGQTCVCANRIYVHSSIAEEFTTRIAEKTKKLKVGDGKEKGVEIGPLIDQDAIDKVDEHVQDAKFKEATVVTGGEHIEGLFYQPTVLKGVTDDMLCMEEETFGPVLPIATFETQEEVIERANDTVFGLAAYVFTENITRGIQICEALEYGIVGLNDGLPSAPQAPFGGFKQSGLGREGGHQGMDEYLEVKYISLGL